MRRVLHVLFDANLSGGQIFAQRLGVALREHGWESEYILPGEGPLTGLLDEAALKWSVVPMDGSPFRVAWRLRRAFAHDRPALVHTHLVLPSQFAARLAAASLRIPLVAHYHIAPGFPKSTLRRRAYLTIDQLGARWLTAMNVAVSESVADRLGGVSRRNSRVVPNGVPVPLAPRLEPSRKTVAVIGRIARAKGQDLALEAIATLARERPETFDLRIVGSALDHADQRFLAELMETAQARGLGARFEVSAAVQCMDNTYNEAWCVLIPSRSGEGMPLVMLEAMAAGIPTIATRLAGVPEVIVDNESGLLVPTEDVDGIVEALDSLLSDESRRQRIGNAARQCVIAKHTIERVAKDIAEIYAGACPEGLGP